MSPQPFLRMTRPALLSRSGVRASLLALVAALTLVGCDTTSDDFDGPLLVDLFGDFALIEPLSASASSVDFAGGESITFEARFNTQSNWTIELVGQESGAVRRITGSSRQITADEARWQGRTTELPLFRAEPVVATLLVDGVALEDSPPVTITTLSSFDYPGIVVADFEGDVDIDVFNPESEFDTVGPSMEVPAAEGDSFFLLRGTDDVVVNNFFIGLATILPPDGAGTFEVPTDIANELYLNFFLYNFGTPNTLPVVEIVVDANGSGTYEEGLDRIIPIGADSEFPNLVESFTADGWQLYSEPASSFGAFGDGISDQQTQEIVAIRVVLISDANNQPPTPLQVDFGIDYLTFTAGSPFQL